MPGAYIWIVNDRLRVEVTLGPVHFKSWLIEYLFLLTNEYGCILYLGQTLLAVLNCFLELGIHSSYCWLETIAVAESYFEDRFLMSLGEDMRSLREDMRLRGEILGLFCCPVVRQTGGPLHSSMLVGSCYHHIKES